MTRYRLVLAGGVLVAVLGASACGGDTAPPAATPAATIQSPVTEASLTTITLTLEAEKRLGVQTVAAERRAVSRTRTVGGELMAPAGAESVVTAPFAGRLDAPSPLPAAGSSVPTGRVIFRLVPIALPERDARVDAERAVAEAVARQEAAASRVRRAQQLATDGAGSRRAAEDAQESLAIANAELKAAQDRLALADRGSTAPGGLAIETPHAGIVRTIHASAGQTVAAGAPLFDVVRLDVLWVRVSLFVGEADAIDPRAPAEIVTLGGPADAAGVIARPIPAPPSADPTTAAVDLYFTLANSGERFRPGQRVGVKLAQTGAVNRLVVPRAAILHDAYGGTWVYEARGNQAYVRRRVAIADMIDSYAVLDSGPEPGTLVVTDGAAELFGTEFGAGR